MAMVTSTRKLFIAGATGAVGQVLVPLALAKGVSLVAHARPQSGDKVKAPNMAVLELADSAALDAAMAGCTTVVQLIGTMRKRFASGDTYETSDIGTTRQLVDAAKRVGTVDHLVLLSSVGAGRPMGAYLKAKAAAESLVANSGIAFTMLRPSAFEDRPGQAMPGARTLMRALGLRRYEPIRLEELARALLHVSVVRAPLGQALEGKSLWQQVELGGASR
jgi:uncharacterized protein YbjT (DUF2867 family)